MSPLLLFLVLLGCTVPLDRNTPLMSPDPSPASPLASPSPALPAPTDIWYCRSYSDGPVLVTLTRFSDEDRIKYEELEMNLVKEEYRKLFGTEMPDVATIADLSDEEFEEFRERELEALNRALPHRSFTTTPTVSLAGGETYLATFQFQGLSRRWDWHRYAFVIELNSIGRYYDFTLADEDGRASPRHTFTCTQ